MATNGMTNQTVFDKVVAHLRKQGEKSMRTVKNKLNGGWMEACAYRGAGGTKCAVGCLVDDSKYDKIMEGKNVYSYEVSSRLPDMPDVSGGLLSALQNVHDFFEARDWEQELSHVAERFSLNLKEPK